MKVSSLAFLNTFEPRALFRNMVKIKINEATVTHFLHDKALYDNEFATFFYAEVDLIKGARFVNF